MMSEPYASYNPDPINRSVSDPNNTWREQAFDRGTISHWAQELGKYLENRGIKVFDTSWSEGVTWYHLIQLMNDAWDDQLGAHVNREQEKEQFVQRERDEEISKLQEQISTMGNEFDMRLNRAYEAGKAENQEVKLTSFNSEYADYETRKGEKIREYFRPSPFIDPADRVKIQINTEGPKSVQIDEQAMMTNDASPTFYSTPNAPQASHKCAHAIRLAMNDGTDMTIPFSHPIAQRGWKVRKLNGVDVLVIGHGVPRRTIPLCNVNFFDLLTEDEL
jgi:hypothetical protein